MNKWIIIIGAVLIIAAIYVGQLVGKKGFPSITQEIKSGFEEMSQAQLNSLVADIEFYKIQHGNYPDSLSRLLVLNKWTFINDPVQANFSRASTYYNYGRRGGKYFLYSSGVDGIPHTRDDIYPQVGPIDSAKIGLLGRE